MENPERHASLGTIQKTHKTKMINKTDPTKNQGSTQVLAKSK
jgi:hypothetical protein